ncbi:MAG: hypothetical protein ABSB96_02335 [Gaiellaceae bacterium]
MEAQLKEVSISSLDRIGEILHDADFDTGEISLDGETETLTIVFDQAVNQLPDDLAPPFPDRAGHGWFSYVRFHELMPFVECELVIRTASAFHLDDDQTWGMLNDMSYDSAHGRVRINSVIGLSIHIDVERFEAAVRISDHVRSYRHITTWFCIFETSGKSLPA